MDKTFRCSECPAIFTKYWNLQRHVQSVHKGNRLSCPICQATFTRHFNLQNHMNVVHGNSKQMGIAKQIPDLLNQQTSRVDQNNQQENVSKSQNDIPDADFYFMHPFTMLVAAGSGFGKTYWVKRLLAEKGRLIQPVPKRVVWCYMHWQPLYDEIKELDPSIEFIHGLPLDLDAGFFNSDTTNLLIVDDMMADISKDNRVSNLYTRGSHHENLSVICLLQNLYYKNTQTMRRNSHYLILFDMPMDKTQVKTMSYQMFPNYPSYLLQMYNKAVSKPYGYLVVVSKPNIKQHERLKTDIFYDDDKETVKATSEQISIAEKRKSEEDLDKISQLPKKSVNEGDSIPLPKIATKNSESETPLANNSDEFPKSWSDYQIISTDKPLMVGGQAYRLEEISNEDENVGGAYVNESEAEAADNSINSSSDDENNQSSSDNESDNMYPCGNCRALFDSKYHMSKHQENCPTNS